MGGRGLGYVMLRYLMGARRRVRGGRAPCEVGQILLLGEAGVVGIGHAEDTLQPEDLLWVVLEAVEHL